MTNTKQLLLACAIATATAALTGCGSAGVAGDPAGDAVAVVAGAPITKAALRHWTAVKLAIDYEANPRKPLPSGVVYEPPDYAPCMARLRALAAAESAASGFTLRVVRLPPNSKYPRGRLSFVKRATKPAKPAPIPATAQLERECAEHYRSVEMGMLNVLIGFQREMQEGKADGVNPSEGEVREEYARYSRKHFPNRGEQRRYLADTGESVGDELLRIRTDMISTRIFSKEKRRFGGIATKAQLQAYGRWAVETEERWVARTSCRAGYIVEDCKQYKTT
jgi:hypothetical protein